jgi:hypothetical protein
MGWADIFNPDKVNKKQERRAEERAQRAEKEERERLIQETKNLYKRETNLIERDTSVGARVELGTDRSSEERAGGRLNQDETYVANEGENKVQPGAGTWLDGEKLLADELALEAAAEAEDEEEVKTQDEILNETVTDIVFGTGYSFDFF